MLDNSSTHNIDGVRAWLADSPRVRFHYTPTSVSWLSQIEGFFGILTKQSLSVTDFCLDAGAAGSPRRVATISIVYDERIESELLLATRAR